MFIVITFLLIINICVFYYMGIILTKPNGNIIMGSTLATDKLQNSEVLEIIKNFKKSNLLFMIISSILILPSYMEYKYPTFAIIYFILYTLIVYFAFQSNLYRYVVEVRALKRKNNWFIENNNITYVDTEVSRLKQKMVLKQYWFIPTIVVYLIAFALKIELFLILQALFTSVVCYGIYLIYKNRRSKTYSKNQEINFACNQIERRVWSIIWTLFSFLYSLSVFVNMNNEIVFLCLIFAITIVILILILYGNNKIRDTQNRLLYSDENVIIQDDDEYWGMFIYNNPNDSRVIVEKRYGVGTTINFGSKKGKIITWVFSIFMIIIMVPVIVIVAVMANADYSMVVSGDNVVIDAPLYGTTFNLAEIQSIDIINTLPKSTKTNGSQTSKLEIGYFNVDGYGKSELYIKNDIHEIIVIKLKDKYIFINADSYDMTDKYYNQLKESL